ncbi:hypothetical protein EDC01DRAFT_629971 [Geopyxis carbonaria]|nr:hypothetical protein EDC01DRAFT_629971 [Geopyxis carbonaria]
MSHQIPPSTLHPLPSLFLPAPTGPKPGSKVRTLGCIHTYAIHSGHLTLTHPPSPHQLVVDVKVALPELEMGLLRDGVWVWVLGYLRVDGAGGQDGARKGVKVRVDAIRVWEAGAGVQDIVAAAEERRGAAAELGRTVEAYRDAGEA